MANPTYTERASDTIVCMHIGSNERAANDSHLTIGKGSGDRSSWVGRAEFRIPEASWPSRGRFVRATLTVEKTTSSIHTEWEGGSPRAWVKRMGERARFSLPDSADGHGSDGYTGDGAGDKYPGGSVTGDPVEFNITPGKTSKDVSSMVEQMMPARILKRSGSAGGDDLYGYFQVRSADEDNANRSFVLTRRISLTVEIDTRVVPEVPTILEVAGAQEELGSSPTVVATDDGRTLEVRWAFAAGANETASKVEMQLLGVGASDATPGDVIRTTGNVAVQPGGGQNIYWARMTGITRGAEGRFRLRATSSRGKQGPWTSLDDADVHVRLATIPGQPANVVVEPTTVAPDITASMPSSHPGTIGGMQARVTLLPQGRVWDSGMEGIGGSLRTATLVYNGEALADGQRTSTVVRLRDEDDIVGRYGAAVTTTHRVPPADTGPEITTAPQRFTTVRPSFTIAASTFDGWKLRLLHETDESIVIYDSGPNVVVDQTSVTTQIPASTLVYGQKFRAVASVVPNGAGTAYGDETTPKPYSIAGLPTAVLTVPDAISRTVAVEDIEWEVQVTDPDGAAVGALDIELREAATPQGSGALHRRWYSAPDNPFTIPDGEVAFETAVDARVRAWTDAAAIWSTTLAAPAVAGATTITVASATGITIGQDLRIASTNAEQYETRRVTNVVSTTVTLDEALAYAHASAQNVVHRPFGPWSPWTTWTVLEPPEVDLLSPADAATVTVPWQELDWSTTGNGGRTQASAVVGLYDADGVRIATVDVDDSTSSANVPAFLLADATSYGWDVTVTDTGGMVTRSATRTFTTAFTELAPLAGVTATAEPDGSSVTVGWDASEDANVHHVEVSWQADDGSWVRIDGGPESLQDGREPFTGTSLLHVGARLGANAYAVSPHDGWRAAEPVNATETLTVGEVGRGTWQAVTADAVVIPLRATDESQTTSAMLDAQQAPGADNRVAAWGIAARTIPMRVVVIPLEDGQLTTTLRSFMADPARGRRQTPVWLKAPAPWLLDPVWAVLSTFTRTPGQQGLLDVAMDWLETGSPVHSILPPAPAEPEEGVGDLVVSEADYDFGDIPV